MYLLRLTEPFRENGPLWGPGFRWFRREPFRENRSLWGLGIRWFKGERLQMFDTIVPRVHGLGIDLLRCTVKVSITDGGTFVQPDMDL